MRGTLTTFNQLNGKGTITSEHGIELLLYQDAVEPSPRPLTQGQMVEFRIYYGPFGPLAENVHALSARLRQA